jgi:hypothetical protein
MLHEVSPQRLYAGRTTENEPRSSFITVCDYGPENGVPSPTEAEDFSSVSRPALGPTQPPVKRVPVFTPGGKAQPERDADYSFPSSA